MILEKFNLSIFNAINSLAGRWGWLDGIFIFCAQWLGYLLILFLIILFLKGKNRRGIIVALISAIIARFVFVEAIRYFVYSPRPFLVLENIHQLVGHDMESSFPSGHASFFFALAMSVYFFNKKTGLAFLILAGLISIARIFVGIHWPLDILAGAVLGVLTSFGFRRLIKKMP